MHPFLSHLVVEKIDKASLPPRGKNNRVLLGAAVTDSGSAQRGQGLATPKNWGNLGFSEHAIWGECAGSGSKPYLVAIDLVMPLSPLSAAWSSSAKTHLGH